MAQVTIEQGAYLGGPALTMSPVKAEFVLRLLKKNKPVKGSRGSVKPHFWFNNEGG